MNTTINVLFYIRKGKINANGNCVIYSRITIRRQRFDFSIGKSVNPAHWSSETSRVKGTTKEARLINDHLDHLKSKILDAEKKLLKTDMEITIENMRNELLGIDARKRMLIPIFKDHNEKVRELVGKEFAPGTLERYETSLKHTVEFLEWKYQVSDIDIAQIDHSFITDYEFFLRSVRNCNNNTAVKYIKNFNKIIRICLANHWIDRNPFANYKAKVKEVERVYLTEEELQDIINKDLEMERLSIVRDIFVFSCFTGLAYIDVKNLKQAHVSIGIDGDKWIFTHRQKTESASKIPILPIAQMIIDKYADHPEFIVKGSLLPISSNQKMNAYLKEIATLCKINKDLTFHIARHTFATTVTLTNGVPIESVSKMLGHKNLRTTQHYAKVLDKKVSEDMKILRNKFSLSNLQSLSKIT